MMKHEFEKIAGYKVSQEDFDNILNPMYNATDLDKFDFVKTINRKRFEVKELTERQIINRIKKDAEHLKEICGHSSDWECEDHMEKMARTLAKTYGYRDDDYGSGYYFVNEYEYPDMRGCHYPIGLVIVIKGTEVKRIKLAEAIYRVW